MPKFSIIVPNYNHCKFLPERFESIFNQTFQDFEVIVLDDCSKDESRMAIESFRGNTKVSHIIYNDENSGSPFKQWHKGIDLAKGQWIWIAESDDFCDSNFLSVALAKLDETGADLFYSKSVRVDENSAKLDEMEWWYSDLQLGRWENDYINLGVDEASNFVARKCTIVNASAVVFKNKPEVLNYLNASVEFKSCGDWLFWLKYLKHAITITYSVSTNNYFRSHAATTRAHIPFNRNFEVLKIYRWSRENLFNGKENFALLKYYFTTHLHFHSRKKLLHNVKFVTETYKYTRYTLLFLIQYYFKVNLAGRTNKSI